MCGRFTLKTPAETISDLFPGLMNFAEFEPRYNIAPTQDVFGVRLAKSSNFEACWLRWGLVPSWAKELKIGAKMINARSETVSEKPSFRSAFKKRRCLILADGYFEWKKKADGKQPYYMTRSDDKAVFCMAGLWECWKDSANNRSIETCSILTTNASPDLQSVHDRMPVVIPPKCFGIWLDTEFQDFQELKSLLKPTEPNFFQTIEVNREVNNVRNDGPNCVQPRFNA